MTRQTLFPIRCAALLLAILWATSAANAQVLYGSVTGNVTDPTSAGIPGAKVEAKNVGTGAAREASTDDRGTYLFTNLLPGIYKIAISAKGFSSVV